MTPSWAESFRLSQRRWGRWIIAALIRTSYLYGWLRYGAVEQRSRAAPEIHAGAAQPTRLWCIFALWVGNSVSPNLVAYLAALKQAGYNIIAVNDGFVAPALIEEVMPYCHSFVARSPGGRDFGSYQLGTRHLRDTVAADRIGQVLYCNDSVFVRPSAFAALLGRIRLMDERYVGVIENFLHHWHIASWFFAISGEVFAADAFKGFWAAYVPMSYKGYIISQGEGGLAKTLLGNDIDPLILYGGDAILSCCLAGSLDEVRERLLLYANREMTERLLALFPPVDDGGAPAAKFAALRRMLSESLTDQIAMNAFNLILLREAGFPFLKKDLVFWNQHHCIQIDRVLADWTGPDAAQRDEIARAFRLRNPLRWQLGPRGALRRLGWIS